MGRQEEESEVRFSDREEALGSDPIVSDTISLFSGNKRRLREVLSEWCVCMCWEQVGFSFLGSPGLGLRHHWD